MSIGVSLLIVCIIMSSIIYNSCVRMDLQRQTRCAERKIGLF